MHGADKSKIHFRYINNFVIYLKICRSTVVNLVELASNEKDPIMSHRSGEHNMYRNHHNPDLNNGPNLNPSVIYAKTSFVPCPYSLRLSMGLQTANADLVMDVKYFQINK